MAKKKQRKLRMLDGLPVVDADSDVVLHVTKKDVQNSKKKNPDECAAAQAGKRELKREVKVFLSRMYVKDKNKWIRYLTPSNAAREIVSFDRGAEFEPGEYKFKAATSGQRLGVTHPGPRPKKSKHGTRQHKTGNVRIRANY